MEVRVNNVVVSHLDHFQYEEDEDEGKEREGKKTSTDACVLMVAV